MIESLTAIGVIGLVAGLAPFSMAAPGEESPAERAARTLAGQLEPRGSVEIRSVVKLDQLQPLGPAGGRSFDTEKLHYIEMPGKRYRDEVYLLEGKRTRRLTSYRDGTRLATVTYKKVKDGEPDRQHSLSVSGIADGRNVRDMTQRPDPIRYLYVGTEPLQKALVRSNYLGDVKILGRDCDRFLFERVHMLVTRDFVYDLDRETGIPLRVELFKDQAAREKGDLDTLWVAETFEKVGDYHVPLKSTLTAYLNSKPAYRWSSTVESITFGKKYPPSTFWTEAEPGVIYSDSTGRKPFLGVIKN